VDSSRVYVAGYSQGAMMAHRVGAELGDRVAAIAAVAGTVGRRFADGTVARVTAPRRPLPVIMFHGTADSRVPYDAPSAGAGGVIGAPETAAFWAEANHCRAEPLVDTLERNAVVRTTYGACDEGADVVLYTLIGAGHIWSGESRHPGPWPAPTPLAWRFFEAHPRTARHD
jgi:polyhydroxybutyrate depolymerase